MPALRPQPLEITTSHIEKQNHTLPMHCRHLTRLTNAFSKKWENSVAAVALNFAYIISAWSTWRSAQRPSKRVALNQAFDLPRNRRSGQHRGGVEIQQILI